MISLEETWCGVPEMLYSLWTVTDDRCKEKRITQRRTNERRKRAKEASNNDGAQMRCQERCCCFVLLLCQLATGVTSVEDDQVQVEPFH